MLKVIEVILWTILGIIILCAMFSCSSKLTAMPKPYTPAVRPVNVKGGCVCGEELRKLIDNWQDINDAFKKCVETGNFQ
jgi:hypothetical protein